MKNRDLFKLYENLKRVSKIGGARFSYGVVKNQKMILAEIDTLQESFKPSEKYQEFDNLRVAICEKHAIKNEDGTPKIENGHYVFENEKKALKEIEDLQKEHKEVVDEQTQK